MGKGSRKRQTRYGAEPEQGAFLALEDEAAMRALVPQLVSHVLAALDRRDHDEADDVVVALAQVCAVPLGRRVIVPYLVTVLTVATTEAWQRGWQPADIHR